jgi:hypothetical protein
MGWIDGRTLNEYVDFLVTGRNTAALATLAGRWLEMVALLQDSEFGHGDLQHGNVMVDQEGQLRLVDFDGVWIPQLAGKSPPTEYGHPNYQRPGLREWNRWVDTFSALVIYTSLVALSKDPGLWLALYNSKNLLFSKGDFFAPFETQAWKQLAALRDPQVDDLAARLRECCHPQWSPNQSLAQVMAPRPAPAAPPVQPQIPAEQRWWEKTPAPPPRAAVPRPAVPRPVAPAPVPYEAAGSPTMIIPAAVTAAASLPAPPPLSAPLGEAGTGPVPRPQHLTPSADASWWTGPRPAPAAGQASPQARQQTPPAPVPPAPVAKPQTGPAIGAVSLGLGVVLLIVGGQKDQSLIIWIGLFAAAWGIWRLVTARRNTKPPGNNTSPPGNSTKPPGQT